MSIRELFVTGTDTDAGKTFIAQALLRKFEERGIQAVGFKPVAAGCVPSADGLRNEDALILQQNSGVQLDYQEVNPIAFEPPAAPHIIAAKMQQPIELDRLHQGIDHLRHSGARLILVEGAGGWRLPLNDEGGFLSDLAIARHMPVILVVGMKLGCLNHSMLTVEAIKHDGLELAGWVANTLDSHMHFKAQNIATLKSLIDAPCLGVVPHLEDAAYCDQYLDIGTLLE